MGPGALRITRGQTRSGRGVAYAKVRPPEGRRSLLLNVVRRGGVFCLTTLHTPRRACGIPSWLVAGDGFVPRAGSGRLCAEQGIALVRWIRGRVGFKACFCSASLTRQITFKGNIDASETFARPT